MKQADVVYTAFGVWFYTNPVVVRTRMMVEFEKAGVPRATVRTWFYRKTVPRFKRVLIVEKITRQEMATLFPY